MFCLFQIQRPRIVKKIADLKDSPGEAVVIEDFVAMYDALLLLVVISCLFQVAKSITSFYSCRVDCVEKFYISNICTDPKALLISLCQAGLFVDTG